jgi:hypothetical protein
VAITSDCLKLLPSVPLAYIRCNCVNLYIYRVSSHAICDKARWCGRSDQKSFHGSERKRTKNELANWSKIRWDRTRKNAIPSWRFRWIANSERKFEHTGVCTHENGATHFRNDTCKCMLPSVRSVKSIIRRFTWHSERIFASLYVPRMFQVMSMCIFFSQEISLQSL